MIQENLNLLCKMEILKLEVELMRDLSNYDKDMFTNGFFKGIASQVTK